MISYIQYIRDYLQVPSNWIPVAVIFFFVLQAIGELLEFKGKVVPEFIKFRKYFQRKRVERETLAKLPELMSKFDSMPDVVKTLGSAQKTLDEINKHYSEDNITMRDNWVESVNQRLEASDKWMQRLDEKLDKNNADTLSLLIDSKRNAIIDFAAYVIKEGNPVTREQYKRIFKIHEEYEAIIDANGLTNGEVDIAHQIIKESYEVHLRNRTFVEDVRGYAR